MQLRMFTTYTRSLEDLRTEVGGCRKCPYYLINDGRVNGVGTPEATIMVVGQGPGPTEVTTGRPFTGGSGKALRSYIRNAGITMKEVYLTNLIRCAQPEGKIIMTKAIRMCGGWLEDEVGLVSPRLIVSLGGLATKELTGAEGVEEHRGRILESKYGVPTIHMFHTAFLLRIRSKDKGRYEELDLQMKEDWEIVAKEQKCGTGGVDIE